MLGQIDDFAAVGELRHIWKRSFLENQLCACGLAFRSCPFWSEVIKLYPGADFGFAPEQVLALQDRIEYSRHIPLVYLAPSASRAGAAREEYKRILLKLYRAIDQVAGGRTIINSSKEASSIFLLSTLPGVEISVVHLVRDSRAVSFSWMRRRISARDSG